MKKPKIKIEYLKSIIGPVEHEAWIRILDLPPYCSPKFESHKAAREWVKEWCRTVGEALMKAGGCDFVMGLRKGQKAEKGK